MTRSMAMLPTVFLKKIVSIILAENCVNKGKIRHASDSGSSRAAPRLAVAASSTPARQAVSQASRVTLRRCTPDRILSSVRSWGLRGALGRECLPASFVASLGAKDEVSRETPVFAPPPLGKGWDGGGPPFCNGLFPRRSGGRMRLTALPSPPHT